MRDPGRETGLRLAWVSPLPPQRTGIADYSAELLPHVAAHERVAGVTAYVEPTVKLGELEEVGGPGGALEVRSLSELTRALERGDHDGVVYHVGNNPLYHAETWRLARERPGVVVLHETMLHHLVRGLTLDKGDVPAYLEEHRYVAGPGGYSIAKRSLDVGVPHDHWAYPLFERLVDRSLGVLVHNDFARRRILASRPTADVGVVPMPVDLSALPDSGSEARTAARRRLGLADDAFVVASFGFITPAKRLPVSLRAFARLRRRHPDAVYLLVGEVSPYYDLDRHLEGEMGEGVRLTGRVPMETFLSAMAACDAAINLRHPTGGETSATLMRLLALGVPTIVTDHGSFREAPEGSCARVPLDPVDDAEEDLLTAYLEALAEDGELRTAMSRIGREHIAAHHTFPQAADAYVSYLERAFTAPHPGPAVAPLAAWAREDLPSELISRVSARVSDLGVDDGDPVLKDVARAMVELGLDS